MTRSEQAFGLTWERCRLPASDADVAAVEKHFGVKLPSDVRDFLRRCHGGRPVERRYFRFQDPRHGMMGSVLAALLTLDPADDGSILATVSDLAYDDQLPDGIIPFAEDGGGDLIGLDVRSSREQPSVVYWNHERTKDKSLVPLADSLAAFLAALEPSDE